MLIYTHYIWRRNITFSIHINLTWLCTCVSPNLYVLITYFTTWFIHNRLSWDMYLHPFIIESMVPGYLFFRYCGNIRLSSSLYYMTCSINKSITAHTHVFIQSPWITYCSIRTHYHAATHFTNTICPHDCNTTKIISYDWNSNIQLSRN